RNATSVLRPPDRWGRRGRARARSASRPQPAPYAQRMDGLPPGPGAAPALQTLEWIARPTVLLRRSAARYGEPFTLRTLWTDAPMVVVSDPATVRRIYAEPPDVLRGGAPLRTLPRMQALTLEVIMRVVFGSRDERLRAALRAALDLTSSLPRL